MEKLLTEKKRGELKNLFIALLFIANVSFANNPLIGKWVMVEECSFTAIGTKYCSSDLGINRESYKIFYEDGTYDYYYKNREWERELFNIDYPDYTEGTYTIDNNILRYSDKVLEGDWEISIDNGILTLYNAKANKMVHYFKEY